MNAKASTTGRPPWSVCAWTDSSHVFIEIPGAPGKPPYIEKYSLTEGGLSKALSFMKSLHAAAEPKGGYYAVPAWPVTKAMKGQAVSENTREKTRAVLRRLRLV